MLIGNINGAYNNLVKVLERTKQEIEADKETLQTAEEALAKMPKRFDYTPEQLELKQEADDLEYVMAKNCQTGSEAAYALEQKYKDKGEVPSYDWADPNDFGESGMRTQIVETEAPQAEAVVAEDGIVSEVATLELPSRGSASRMGSGRVMMDPMSLTAQATRVMDEASRLYKEEEEKKAAAVKAKAKPLETPATKPTVKSTEVSKETIKKIASMIYNNATYPDGNRGGWDLNHTSVELGNGVHLTHMYGKYGSMMAVNCHDATRLEAVNKALRDVGANCYNVKGEKYSIMTNVKQANVEALVKAFGLDGKAAAEFGGAESNANVKSAKAEPSEVKTAWIDGHRVTIRERSDAVRDEKGGWKQIFVTETRFENGHMKSRVPHDAQGLSDGEVEEWYENGQLKSREHFKNGVRIGRSITWHKNGNVESEVKYNDDNIDGPYEAWYPNGQLKYRFNFKDGKKDGKQEAFDENGKLLERYTYKNGTQIMAETFYDISGKVGRLRAAAMAGGGRIGNVGDTYRDVVERIRKAQQVAFKPLSSKSSKVKAALDDWAKSQNHGGKRAVASAILDAFGEQKTIQFPDGVELTLTQNGIENVLSHMNAKNVGLAKARADFILNLPEFAKGAVKFYEEMKGGKRFVNFTANATYNGQKWNAIATMMFDAESQIFVLNDVNAMPAIKGKRPNENRQSVSSPVGRSQRAESALNSDYSTGQELGKI